MSNDAQERISHESAGSTAAYGDRCLCAERDLLGDDEQRCGGYGAISDELCEQAYRETVAAEPPAAWCHERSAR